MTICAVHMKAYVMAKTDVYRLSAQELCKEHRTGVASEFNMAAYAGATAALTSAVLGCLDLASERERSGRRWRVLSVGCGSRFRPRSISILVQMLQPAAVVRASGPSSQRQQGKLAAQR